MVHTSLHHRLHFLLIFLIIVFYTSRRKFVLNMYQTFLIRRDFPRPPVIAAAGCSCHWPTWVISLREEIWIRMLSFWAELRCHIFPGDESRREWKFWYVSILINEREASLIIIYITVIEGLERVDSRVVGVKTRMPRPFLHFSLHEMQPTFKVNR